MYRIALRVTGVDLDDDATLAALRQSLDDLGWLEIDGRTLAILRTTKNPVGSAVQAAQRVAAVLPQAKVTEVDQDLVAISDIARRVGITRKAVQLWVDGKRGPGGFPPPAGSVDGGECGSKRLWQWPAVSEWLRQYGLPDEEALSPSQVTEVNAALARISSPPEPRLAAWSAPSRIPVRPMRFTRRHVPTTQEAK